MTVLPITHRTPADPASAVEIPSPVKRHFGLDDDPSWIVTRRDIIARKRGILQADLRIEHV